MVTYSSDSIFFLSLRNFKAKECSTLGCRTPLSNVSKPIPNEWQCTCVFVADGLSCSYHYLLIAFK